MLNDRNRWRSGEMGAELSARVDNLQDEFMAIRDDPDSPARLKILDGYSQDIRN